MSIHSRQMVVSVESEVVIDGEYYQFSIIADIIYQNRTCHTLPHSHYPALFIASQKCPNVSMNLGGVKVVIL